MIMASCCGNNKGNKKVKEWGNEESKNKSIMGLNPIYLIVGLIVIGIIVYKIVM